MDFVREQVPQYLPQSAEVSQELQHRFIEYCYRILTDGRGLCKDEGEQDVVHCSDEYLAVLLEHVHTVVEILSADYHKGVSHFDTLFGHMDDLQDCDEEFDAPSFNNSEGSNDTKAWLPSIATPGGLLRGLIPELRRLHRNPCLFADSRTKQHFFAEVQCCFNDFRDLCIVEGLVQETDSHLSALKAKYENDTNKYPVSTTTNGIEATSKPVSWTSFVKDANRHGKITTQAQLKEKLRSGKPEGGVWTAILSLPQGCVLVLERWIESHDAITQVLESDLPQAAANPLVLKATYLNVYRPTTIDADNEWMSGRSLMPRYSKILSLPNAKTVQGEAPVGLAAFLGQLNDKKRRGHPFMYERLDLLKKVHDSDVKWLLATVDEKEGRELIKELIKFT